MPLLPNPPVPQCSRVHPYAGLCRTLAGAAGAPHTLLRPHPGSSSPSPAGLHGEGLGARCRGDWGCGPYLQQGEAPLHVFHEVLLLLGVQGRGEQRQQQQAAPGPHGRQRLQPPAQCSGMLRPPLPLLHPDVQREGRQLLPRRPAPGALTPSCPSRAHPARCPELRGWGRSWGRAGGGSLGV